MLCSVVSKFRKAFHNSSRILSLFSGYRTSHSLSQVQREIFFNFDSENNLKITNQGSSSHFSKDVKCSECGKFGHKQAQCRSKTVTIVCYECGEKGHATNACPKAQ